MSFDGFRVGLAFALLGAFVGMAICAVLDAALLLVPHLRVLTAHPDPFVLLGAAVGFGVGARGE